MNANYIIPTYIYEDKIPAKMEGNPMHAHRIPPQEILVAIFSSFRHCYEELLFGCAVYIVFFTQYSTMTRCIRGRIPHICMQLHHPIRHQFPLFSKQVLKSHSNIPLWLPWVVSQSDSHHCRCRRRHCCWPIQNNNKNKVLKLLAHKQTHFQGLCHFISLLHSFVWWCQN